MIILIYSSVPVLREILAHHIIDRGHHYMFFADDEPHIVSLALNNPIDLLVLVQPGRVGAILDIKDFLKQRRPRMRVRLLHDNHGILSHGWREIVDKALLPAASRPKTHPRFTWTPNT